MKSNWVRAGAVGAVLVSSVVAVDLIGAPTGAQTMGTGPVAFAGVDSGPVVSDEALTVVFQSDAVDGSGSTIAVYERDAPAEPGTNPAAISGSAMGVRPGVSGDGCFVAWSVDGVEEPQLLDPALGNAVDSDDAAVPEANAIPDDEPAPEALQAATPARLVVRDRCTSGTPPVPVAGGAEIGAATTLGAPALSLDGSVLAVSTGQEVVILRRDASGYTRFAATDGTATAAPTRVTDEHVDVSDDGSVVVFSSGPRPTPATRDVMAFEAAAGATSGVTTRLLAGATHPGLSGDGTILVAQQGPQVVVTPIPVAPVKNLGAGSRPVISGDGNHVVFDTANGVAIRSWTGADVAPFTQVDDRTISGVTSPSLSGPAIDRYGTLIATDVVVPDPVADTDIAITTSVAEAAFGSATYDLGVGDVGDELTGTLDITNDGPATFVVDTITVGGSFVIEPDTCLGVLRSGTTCAFDVSFTVERLEDAVADVSVTGLLLGSGSFTAEVEALGQAPATTTTSTTAPSGTTTGGGTTGGTSTSSTSGGTSSSTSGGTSSTTTGRTTSTTTTGRTTSTTTGRTTSTTTGRTTSTTTTTTTTLPAGSGVVISPAAFAFAPTIVDSGGRTGAVEVVNSAAAAASIDAVALRGDASFLVATDGCSGVVLGEGERCTITVDFAPTVVGDASAEIAVLVAGGRELTAALSGVGAAEPQLSVVPGAAQAGQVVTVRGDGFPTGLSVELVTNGDVQTAVVDSGGSFSHPVVIMANTPSGPLDIVVLAQDDQFGEVTTTMLVRASDDRSAPSVLDGVGVNVGR